MWQFSINVLFQMFFKWLGRGVSGASRPYSSLHFLQVMDGFWATTLLYRCYCSIVQYAKDCHVTPKWWLFGTHMYMININLIFRRKATSAHFFSCPSVCSYVLYDNYLSTLVVLVVLGQSNWIHSLSICMFYTYCWISWHPNGNVGTMFLSFDIIIIYFIDIIKWKGATLYHSGKLHLYFK